MLIHDKPMIVHQGIDTLRTSHIIKSESAYIKYKEFLDFLENEKQNAILNNADFEHEHGMAFEFLTFGKFFILPKGLGRYKYVIMNDDITINFSTLKYGANDFKTPQITIDYRSKFLTLNGHQKCYDIVQKILLKIIDKKAYEDNYKTLLQRIDFATDIANIDYVPLDKYRFQTRFKNVGHIEFKEYVHFNRLTGFSFGSGSYMFRIYNKRLEINRNASKLYFASVWEKNGYDPIKKNSVWRHELQLRRKYIKTMIPNYINDEVSYIFDNIGKFWAFGFDKLEYVNLTDNQVLKLVNEILPPDTIKSMFYRTKKSNKNEVWEMARAWQGVNYEYPTLYKDVKYTDYKTSKRFLKAFISTAYKSDNGNPLSAIKIMDLVSDELCNKEGITLHDYGEIKLLSSFIDNAQTIIDYGLVVHYDYVNASAKLFKTLQDRLLTLEVESFEKEKFRLARLFNTIPEDLEQNINYYLQIVSDDEKQNNIEMDFTI